MQSNIPCSYSTVDRGRAVIVYDKTLSLLGYIFIIKMKKTTMVFGIVFLVVTYTMSEPVCTVLKKGVCKLNYCNCLKKDASLEIPAETECAALLVGNYPSSQCSLAFLQCNVKAGCIDNK